DGDRIGAALGGGAGLGRHAHRVVLGERRDDARLALVRVADHGEGGRAGHAASSAVTTNSHGSPAASSARVQIRASLPDAGASAAPSRAASGSTKIGARAPSAARSSPSQSENSASGGSHAFTSSAGGSGAAASSAISAASLRPLP